MAPPLRPPSRFRPARAIDQSPLHENRALVAGIERRTLLRGGVSLGALTMLTGCDVTNRESVQSALGAMSHWNDRVQAFLFSPTRLAAEFGAADVQKVPRWNAYKGRDQVPKIDPEAWRLDLAGLVSDKRQKTLRDIMAMPHATQRTRHICVEGWDYIGEWSGVPMHVFLDSIGADKTAKYVGFKCADGYWGSIDMASALHPQTILATKYAGETITNDFGFPIRLKAPTKLGFKQPKQILAIEVTNTNPGGYWEERGFNWFSGL
jgi:DMSO/TMAO reductase YedYZ molybdopterin-dependent catalytic subunit